MSIKMIVAWTIVSFHRRIGLHIPVKQESGRFGGAKLSVKTLSGAGACGTGGKRTSGFRVFDW